MGIISAPELLNSKHITHSFDCGTASLNDWLIKRALKNQDSGASRSFVICHELHVAGYYALASGSVERMSTPKPMTRNMPDVIPVIILARLAITINQQQKGLGAALLKDALLRTLTVAQNIGVRALLVHAISLEAKRFYQAYGFQVSPCDDMTLMLSIKDIKAHLCS